MHFLVGTFSHLTAPLPSLSLCLPHSKSMPKTQVLSLTIFSSSQQYWCSRSIHWKSSLVVTARSYTVSQILSVTLVHMHGVGLVHHLVLDVLHELAQQFSHVEALSVLRLLDDRGTFLFVDILAVLCLVSVAGLLLVGQTLILVNSTLYRVAVILVFNLINFIRRIVVLVNRWLIGAPVTKNKVWLIWYKTSIHQGNHTKKKEDHYCNSVAGEDTIMIQNFNQNVYSSNY